MSTPPLIAALDAHYAAAAAAGGCVLFEGWRAPDALSEATVLTSAPADYEPGAFYKRELPVLLALLDKLDARPEIVIVDGYTRFGPGRPALGAHLRQALGGGPIIVGVAKTPYAGAEGAADVIRGGAARPLIVTADGIDVAAAATAVAAMSGPYRLPTHLKRADALARAALKSPPPTEPPPTTR